jgi:hypothetical protein
VTKLNWEKQYSEPDPARYQPPTSNAAMLPDDHEARLESRRKAAKKRAEKKKKLRKKL